MRASTLLLASSIAIAAFAQQAPPTIANKEMDAVVSARFVDDKAPGAAILVAKGGTVIYRRGVGMGDVSASKPIATDGVFRIGSVTKQFTAVAILQLVAQGKLALTDEVQTYVDFPKKDQPITIEHLLRHTSGISNYTDLPSFVPENYSKDVSLKEVIATFADLPLEFAPGTKWNYSNSGYILLGAVIERASGLTWEHYLQKNIFGPLDMQHTSASPENGQLPGEVIGYQEGEKGWEPGIPLSMTWPHAAGTIRSTVDDLFTWNTAVFSGKLVSKELLAMAHTDHLLNDGSSTHYGYGWFFQNVQGSPTIEHNGGINGFVSASLYLPKDDIYVAVLCNSETDAAGALAPLLAAIAMGKPYGGSTMQVPLAKLKELEGVYVSKDSVIRYITADEKGLHSQRQGSAVRDLSCTGEDQFIYTGDVITLTFVRKDGKVTGARFVSRSDDQELTLSNEPLPVRTAVKADPEALKRYVGVYELAPGFTVTFRAEGDRLYGQATGQTEFEAFAQGPDRFFLKVVDARIEFYPEADGTVNRMKLIQGAEMEGMRVK